MGTVLGWLFERKPQYSGTYVVQGGQMGEATLLEHLDGVPWWRARKPPRRHLCWAQTRGHTRSRGIYRCACGAVAFAQDGPWMERNSRRRRRER